MPAAERGADVPWDVLQRADVQVAGGEFDLQVEVGHGFFIVRDVGAAVWPIAWSRVNVFGLFLLKSSDWMKSASASRSVCGRSYLGMIDVRLIDCGSRM